jgi:uncharacterized protein (TIGR03435 family)
MRQSIVSVMAVAVPAVIWAQSPAARSEFEVASIKRNVGGDLSSRFMPSVGRLSVINMKLTDLLATAYEIRDFQISGGPGWIDSERYDIEAKADGKTGPKQMAEPMLQALLEDRFKLRVHRETKELPIYVLTVAKSGLKIQPAEEGSCVIPEPGKPAAPGQRQSAFCGFHVIGRGRYDATHTSVPALATDLSSVLSRTVVDKTALTEAFDIHLRFAPEDAADSTSPSIFTAVQEQLGLRLESGKGPVEVLVIDQVERPSEN